MRPRLPHTVTKKSQASVSSAGDPTLGSATTIRARVQNGRDRTATDVNHSVVVYTLDEVKVDDVLWLPGDDTSVDSQGRQPVQVTRSPSLSGGQTLWKVLL